jgi:group II intron reverse transcriptase/maturase
MAGTSGPNNPTARKSSESIDKVQQLQRRLWVAAKRDPGRRFHALYDRIHRSDVLREAWRRVRANRGSAGVDRETIALVEQRGVESFLSELEETLRRGEYRPKVVLRRYIPKADGKKRPLGIPTVRDRVVQMATKLVIEPIFEADFLPSSFGFRPKRSATQGLEVLRVEGNKKNHVVDADIRDYFGSIDQAKLLTLVEKRVSDRRVLKLCRQWLEAGVMLPPEEGGKVSPTTSGTPQGGVISPLLSNIYLHVLDDVWARKCSHLGTLVRYADDFVVMTSTSGQCIESERRIGIVLQRLGLELHPDKTRRVDLSRGREGFDFLGCHLHKRLSGPILEKEGRHVHFLHRWPSARSMKRVRERVHGLTGRDRNGVKDVRVLINDLNPNLRGWGAYFKTGNAAQKFNQVDDYVHERLRNFMVRRQGRNLKAGQFSTWTHDFFVNLGLHRLRGTIEYPGQRRMPRSENPSVSRVREIRTHGLKGGSTLSTIKSKVKG